MTLYNNVGCFSQNSCFNTWIFTIVTWDLNLNLSPNIIPYVIYIYHKDGGHAEAMAPPDARIVPKITEARTPKRLQQMLARGPKKK